jgi:hypothetical protein
MDYDLILSSGERSYFTLFFFFCFSADFFILYRFKLNPRVAAFIIVNTQSENKHLERKTP